MTKSKAFADNKFNVAKIIISVCDRVENIVGKGDNAGSSPYNVFESSLFQGHQTPDCVVKRLKT